MLHAPPVKHTLCITSRSLFPSAANNRDLRCVLRCRSLGAKPASNPGLKRLTCISFMIGVSGEMNVLNRDLDWTSESAFGFDRSSCCKVTEAVQRAEENRFAAEFWAWHKAAVKKDQSRKTYLQRRAAQAESKATGDGGGWGTGYECMMVWRLVMAQMVLLFWCCIGVVSMCYPLTHPSTDHTPPTMPGRRPPQQVLAAGDTAPSRELKGLAGMAGTRGRGLVTKKPNGSGFTNWGVRY